MLFGIVGNGYVGKATRKLGTTETTNFEELEAYKKMGNHPLGRDFGSLLYWPLVYDTDKSKCEPEGLVIEDLKRCDIVFVCVPTPSLKDGTCDTSIVEGVVNQLKNLGIEKIIVRSTVPVGTCSKLKVLFMPEFLTEKNWEEDFYNTSEWIVGIDDVDYGDDLLGSEIGESLGALLNFARYNGYTSGSKIIWTSTREAEACKLVRNGFLATKVSFCNEVYNWCKSEGMDHEVVLSLMSLDSRIGSSHTSVPGTDGKYGFGGTCFPKDAKSLLNQIEAHSKSYIVRAAIDRNEEIDRPEKDWENDKGRAVSF